ncbi:coiled-coil domain-containing protein 42 homolog [Scleropages formosus]|uniref:coiled-coil domain-containing protein 42 homolog n=1 Tax=Scleropages formosus TaxID=113540 RepID=UPI0010FAB30A|nr:cilia- and flagella-associated protein 73 [Scleropages formosus]
MSLNVDDYFRTVYEQRLRAKVSLPDLKTGDTRKLDKLEEVKDVERVLTAQREDFRRRTESLRRRRKELDEKEEQLKESLFKFNKFLKENDAKRGRALKKASEEKDLARQKQAEVELLEQEVLVLQKRRETMRVKVQRKAVYRDFLHRVTKSSTKFGEIWELVARFDTLLATREQLLGRESEGRQLGEALRQQHRRFVDEQSDRILRYNNQLSELQTRLEQVRSLALKWEATWNHIQSISARETLLLGQIKVTTLNLFHMMGGQTDDENGVGIGDTLGQLDRIELFVQDQTGILHHLQGRDSKSDPNVNPNAK